MDLQVRGSLTQPVTNGFFRLEKGKFTPTLRHSSFRYYGGRGAGAPRDRLTKVSARANKGEIKRKRFHRFE